MHFEDKRWWKAEGDSDLCERLARAAQDVDEATLERQEWVIDSYCLYGDRSALDSYEGRLGGWVDEREPMTQNIVAGAVDALLAEVTQTKPRPMFMTVGGSWMDQQRARRMTQFFDAQRKTSDFRSKVRQATRDAIICGIGVLLPKIDWDREEVVVDRIFPGHFLVDDKNCLSTSPRTFYVRHIMDRYHLMELYPDHADVIEGAGGPENNHWYTQSYIHDDVLQVWEAWHLPSTPTSDDGRHVLAIEEAVLLDESYEHDDPPFAFVRAVEPIRGFWGESLTQRAAPTQERLNEYLERIDDSLYLHARPIIFIPRAAGVVKAHIVNEVGTMVEYSGNTPPTYYTPQSMGNDVYQWVGQLRSQVFDLMGVSEMSATSIKPRGLDSGAALDAYNDVQSKRFNGLEGDFENLHVRLAMVQTRLERRIAETNPGHEVVYSSKHTKTEVKIPWREIDLDEDSFRIQVFPASAFPTNPAHKIQALEGMLGRGVIDMQTFYELALDIPDLEGVRARVMAPLELIHRRLDMILYDDEFLPPDGIMDLQLAIRETGYAIQRAEVEGAPEDRIERLREFLDHAKRLLDQAAEQAAEEQAAQAPPLPPGVAGAQGGMGVDVEPPLPPDGGPMGGGGVPPMPPPGGLN